MKGMCIYMTKKGRKRKLKVGRIIIASAIGVIVLGSLIFGVVFLMDKLGEASIVRTDVYLASDYTTVQIFDIDEEGNLNVYEEGVRVLRLLV